MKRSFVLVCAIALAGFGMATHGASPCEGKDPARYIAGGEECLVFKAFGVDSAGNAPTLVVFLHGDATSVPADYMQYFAQRFVRPGVVGVVLLRPGYYDSEGNYSTDGELKNQYDNYTPHNVDAVASAIRVLKERYLASRVILVGHSGGAAYAGVILAKHPNLADDAILIACNCKLDAWRAMRNGGSWSASLSPHDFVGSIPLTTRVIAVSGTADSTVPSAISRKYIELLVARGIRAEFREIPNVAHSFRFSDSPVLVEALKSLIDEAAR